MSQGTVLTRAAHLPHDLYGNYPLRGDAINAFCRDSLGKRAYRIHP
jgi:hypothetical protein